jgi:D-alanyl-D-alanine carboxypeptidase
VDLTSAHLAFALDSNMADQPEGKWLASHAHRFGFALSYQRGGEVSTGYAFEPWHYRYIGRAAAAELVTLGLPLEKYLTACALRAPYLSCPRP